MINIPITPFILLFMFFRLCLNLHKGMSHLKKNTVYLLFYTFIKKNKKACDFQKIMQSLAMTQYLSRQHKFLPTIKSQLINHTFSLLITFPALLIGSKIISL